MDLTKLRASTHVLMGGAVAAGSLLQIPELHEALAKAVANHPRWIGVLGAATAIAALLHNPQVQDVLGIKRTVKVEEVELKPKGEGV